MCLCVSFVIITIISPQETIEAMAQLQFRKAAGVDDIPPEILKFCGPMLHVKQIRSAAGSRVSCHKISVTLP